MLAAVLAYLAAFSPGMGPVPWAVNSEIYPVQVALPPSSVVCVRAFPIYPCWAPLRAPSHADVSSYNSVEYGV